MKDFEECHTAEKPRGANSTRTGRKSQAPSLQLQETIESTINPPQATTIKNHPSIQLLL